MKEPLTERMLYWMFGWLYDFKEPSVRFVFLPIAVTTLIIGVIPFLVCATLSMVLKPEEYDL